MYGAERCKARRKTNEVINYSTAFDYEKQKTKCWHSAPFIQDDKEGGVGAAAHKRKIRGGSGLAIYPITSSRRLQQHRNHKLDNMVIFERTYYYYYFRGGLRGNTK